MMGAPTIAANTDFEMVDLDQVQLDPVWSRCLPASGARRFSVIALCRLDGEVIVATSNPHSEKVRAFLLSVLAAPFRIVRADQAAIRRLMGHLYASSTVEVKNDGTSDSCETVEVCDELLRAAFLRGASDLHLVPGEHTLQVRLRVDGVLEDYKQFPANLQAGLVSRIKILAGMDIAEKRQPQDGRFTVKSSAHRPPTDVRVATIPTRYGERATLRLLTPMQGLPSFEQLGMDARDLALFNRALASSNGLILFTGPTGSGKSTSLYTAIRQLLRLRGGNVITVEDPIEYEIPGASQVEVDATDKVSFPKALRSILRHDPDVIMLGEIRDAETAELAIKAALTGHLVFSTLHTNTAAGAVVRLIDMGVQPFLIAATLRLAVAQRLVRKLCTKCSAQSELSLSDATLLGAPELAGDQAREAVGCMYCAGKGFVGRSALFEMLAGGPELSELISSNATEADLLRHMRQTGATLLIDDGLRKLRSGTTTTQQVLNAVSRW